jgi:hypothetical protein
VRFADVKGLFIIPTAKSSRAGVRLRKLISVHGLSVQEFMPPEIEAARSTEALSELERAKAEGRQPAIQCAIVETRRGISLDPSCFAAASQDRSLRSG